MMNKLICCVLSVSLLLTAPLSADLNKDLNDFFQGMGASSNLSTGDIYSGQKAGYATGGGFTVRNRSMNTKPLTINPPRFDAGCGGIDIFAGGFSFINEDQLVDTMKSIGSSAVSYAFLLGLETVSPQISNGIKQLQSWMNDINDISINSCESGATLAGAVWPKNQEASQHVCKSIGTNLGAFSDYVSGRHGCADQGKHDEQSKRAEESEYKDIFKEEQNIAWEAINKQSLLKNDKELAEHFMTLTGTIITTKDRGANVFASNITNEDYLNVLLNGGEAEIYNCVDKEKCLSIDLKKVVILQEESWSEKIKEEIREIQARVLRDEQLKDEQLELLTKSSLPLYRIINVMTAYNKGISPIELNQLAEEISSQLLLSYLQNVIDIVKDGAFSVKANAMYEDQSKDFIAKLNSLELRIYQDIRKLEKKSNQQFQMFQKIELLEKKVAAEIRL
jgi:conjugative transfer pilus assembly protein TraH